MLNRLIKYIKFFWKSETNWKHYNMFMQDKAYIESNITVFFLFSFAFFLLSIIPVLIWGDVFVFRFVQNSGQGKFIYDHGRAFLRYGLYPVYAVFIVCFFREGFLSDFRYRVLAAGYLLAQFTSSLIVSYPVKILVGKSRPMYGFCFIGPTASDKFHSFPSGHAGDVFCSAAFIFCLFPLKRKTKYFFLLYTVIIAYSRVLLRRHYLSDVAFGALLGTVVSILFIYRFVLLRWFPEKKQVYQR